MNKIFFSHINLFGLIGFNWIKFDFQFQTNYNQTKLPKASMFQLVWSVRPNHAHP